MRVPEKKLNEWKKMGHGVWYMDFKPLGAHLFRPKYVARSAWTKKNEASVAASNIRKIKRQARVKKTSLGWTVFSR